jgi:hypothetical protein
VFPATESVADGDVVPMPSDVELTVKVGVEEKPTWKVEAALLAKPEPRANDKVFPAVILSPKANDAVPEAVMFPVSVEPMAKDPSPVAFIFLLAAVPKATEPLPEEFICPEP